ncbi:MAG: O-antigen ligase family protein [Bryobacteraceae bacterium]|nr:O-antigen ligase family protein [Bryobacteraceae bacterium]
MTPEPRDPQPHSQPFARLGEAFAVALCLLAFLTLWVSSRWAVAAVQIGIYALALGWLAAFARRGVPVRFHPLVVILALAALWPLLQLALGRTAYVWATENAALDWFTRLAVFFLALQAFHSESRSLRARRLLLWFGFAAAVQASLQKFTAPERIFWLFPTELTGVMGPFVYHNQYAAFIETVLPLALVAALQQRERSWLYAAVAAVMIASVIAGESRAGAFVLFLETLAVLALWKRRARWSWRRMWPAAAVTALFALAFVAVMGSGPLWQKLRRADPWGERRQLTYSSVEMALDRPWTGFGLGAWSVAYPAYARFDDGLFDNQAHNDWAQWAAEGGIPFFLLMLALAVLLVRPALATVWGIGLLGVLLHCLVDYHFQQRPAFGYYYFALAGLAVAARLPPSRWWCKLPSPGESKSGQGELCHESSSLTR